MEIPEKEDEEGGEAGGGGGKEELPADTHHFCHNRDIKSVATKPVGGKEGDDASSLKPIEEAALKETDRRDEGKLKAKAKAKVREDRRAKSLLGSEKRASDRLPP
ncbi:hypothetical protein HZH68_016498 [Vespula germanica]|uniref:Uncharacterized protein n=1 Tax=Vespula germanica TaxID=30212 RepID=A0A834J2K3_VESGE|nr:hypothetical protein HZH68_016498 [Vespula germanica]